MCMLYIYIYAYDEEPAINVIKATRDLDFLFRTCMFKIRKTGISSQYLAQLLNFAVLVHGHVYIIW